jgi:hypothetical protein
VKRKSPRLSLRGSLSSRLRRRCRERRVVRLRSRPPRKHLPFRDRRPARLRVRHRLRPADRHRERPALRHPRSNLHPCSPARAGRRAQARRRAQVYRQRLLRRGEQVGARVVLCLALPQALLQSPRRPALRLLVARRADSLHRRRARRPNRQALLRPAGWCRERRRAPPAAPRANSPPVEE